MFNSVLFFLRCAAPKKAAARISVQFDVLELGPIVSHDFDQRIYVLLNCFAFYDFAAKIQCHLL